MKPIDYGRSYPGTLHLLDESGRNEGEILDEFKSELQSALMQWITARRIRLTVSP